MHEEARSSRLGKGNPYQCQLLPLLPLDFSLLIAVALVPHQHQDREVRPQSCLAMGGSVSGRSPAHTLTLTRLTQDLMLLKVLLHVTSYTTIKASALLKYTAVVDWNLTILLCFNNCVFEL